MRDFFLGCVRRAEPGPLAATFGQKDFSNLALNERCCIVFPERSEIRQPVVQCAQVSPNPDLIVSFDLDVPPSEIESVANGYTISEVGKPPEFVLEVASETTARRDETVKRDTYARFGVSEYWRFDRTGGRYYVAALAGDRLVEATYQPIPTTTDAEGIIRGYSTALGLELHAADWQTVNRLGWPISDWEQRMRDWQLRFWNPATEEYLPDLLNALETLNAERAARLAVEEEVRRLRAELGR